MPGKQTVTVGGLTFATDGAAAPEGFTLWLDDLAGWGSGGGPGVRADRTTRLWGHGEFTERSWRDARLVTMTGDATAPNEQIAALAEQQLNALLGEGLTDRLTVKDTATVDMWATAKLFSEPKIGWKNDTTATFQVQLICPDGRRYGEAIAGSTGVPVPGGGLAFDLFAGTFLEARRNYSTNPQALTPGTGFAAYLSGLNEVGTTTWLTSQADGPPGGPSSYGRWTVTTPKTSTSTGWAATAAANRAVKAGPAGAQESVSVWVRYTGPGTTNVTLRATAYNSIGGNAGQADSTPYTLQSGVWTRLSVTTTATGDYTTVGWWIYQTSAYSLPAGSTLDATGALVGSAGAYFDGSTPDAVAADYAWAGTPGASVSIESTPAPGSVPGILDFGAAGDPGTVTLTNTGTADSPAQIFRITGTTPATGFTIRHLQSERVLQYAAPLAPGDELVLDAADGSAWLNGYADRGTDLIRREWVRLGRGETGTWLLESPDSTDLRMEVEVNPAWW